MIHLSTSSDMGCPAPPTLVSAVVVVFSEITSRCLPVQTHLCHVDADDMITP